MVDLPATNVVEPPGRARSCAPAAIRPQQAAFPNAGVNRRRAPTASSTTVVVKMRMCAHSAGRTRLVSTTPCPVSLASVQVRQVYPAGVEPGRGGGG